MLGWTRSCLKRHGAGIIGLPNVGKSTFFNALTASQQAKTGNFPFCTIDPNVAKVSVVDERLRSLAKFTGASKVVDVEMDLVDVAGLIAGASKGAGLGNMFLSNIRQCGVVMHMVRCFECEKEGFDTPHPLDDIRVIQNELILSDLEAVEKRLSKAVRTRKGSDPEIAFLKTLKEWLEDGKPGGDLLRRRSTGEAVAWMQSYQLLSSKPMLLVLNVDEESVNKGNAFTAEVEKEFGAERTCRVSAAIEEQTSQLSREDQLTFLQEYDISAPCGEVLLRRVYRELLLLQSFFTVGPLMSHGWSIGEGETAKEAAGAIHSDFSKHFIRAKVMQWDAFIKKPNLESAEMQMTVVNDQYIMQDGDVMIVDHSAS